jgi:hypothetical protein
MLLRIAIFLLLALGAAQAQTSPGFVSGAVLCANYPDANCSNNPPTNPLSLNQAFQNKSDFPTPTLPPGNNSANPASTAYVDAAVTVGAGSLATLPPFTTVCNATGVTAPAQACPAITAVAPLGISGSAINVNTSTTNGIFIGGAGPAGAITTNSIGIGQFSLLALNTGANGNFGLGNGALIGITTGANNIGIGINAGSGLTGAASSNVAVGSGILGISSTGISNTAGGASALNKATGSNNTAWGSTALFDVTSGSTNTAIGNGSGRGNLTGSNNTTVGGCNLGGSVSGTVALCDGAGNYRYDYGKTVATTNTLQGGPTNIASQLYSTTGTPTIGSGTCGAGTNGTVGAGSTNQSGFITIGAAATATCTLAWSATLAVAPNACVFFPGNAAAAATGTTVAFAGAPSTASVVLNGTALANTVYRYSCL